MQAWQVGGVRIRSLLEHVLPAPPEHFLVGADADEVAEHLRALGPGVTDEQGRLAFWVQAFLVESQGQRILVDACLGNDRRLPYAPPLNTDLLERLTAAGFGPAEVDVVTCTHLHSDHVGWLTHRVRGRWVPTFPSARHVFARAEHEHWHDHESAFVDLSDTVEVVTAECRHELVEVDHAFTDEVRFVPSPGHTPGHVSVGIRSHGQEALISGDLLHHPLQLVEPSWSSVADDDRAAAERTRRQVLADVAARDVLFIGTHFAAPSAGHVREAAPSGFAWLPAAPAAGSGS